MTGRARRLRVGMALAALLLVAGSANAKPSAIRRHWQRLISQHDKARLREWRTAWVTALAQARAAGFGDAIDREGVLLQPDVALDDPSAPDGDYRCRLFKLGKATLSASPGFVALPPARCRIAGGRLDVLDGVQRPGGQLYRYDGLRILLLGGMAIGDEQGTVRYGRDGQRDLLGLMERIGPQRWRVAFPEPAWQSRMDVLELVPADPGQR